jgi:hypothetical protein
MLVMQAMMLPPHETPSYVGIAIHIGEVRAFGFSYKDRE